MLACEALSSTTGPMLKEYNQMLQASTGMQIPAL